MKRPNPTTSEAILKLIEPSEKFPQIREMHLSTDLTGLSGKTKDFTFKITAADLKTQLVFQATIDKDTPSGDGSARVFFYDPEDDLKLSNPETEVHTGLPLKTSIDGKIWIITWTENKILRLVGRMNATSCHAGTSYSITVRAEGWTSVANEVEFPQLFIDSSYGAAPAVQTDSNNGSPPDPRNRPKVASSGRDPLVAALLANDFAAKTSIPTTIDQINDTEFLFGLDTLSSVLHELVISAGSMTGLIVISGSTGGGKSTVVRDLIARILYSLAEESKTRKSRKPHLVTIEDPIEAIASESGPSNSISAQQKSPIDYTPRRIGIDTPSVTDALRDCKRMTPAIVYVGETRDHQDWEAVMEFAGSGHLIITTTHAASVVETIQRIFKAVNVTTPASRGQAADTIKAVIHLKSFKCRATHDSKPYTLNATLPGVWLSSAGGGVGLISDGLASIVPNLCTKKGNLPAYPSLGRYGLAKHIAKGMDTKPLDKGNKMSVFWTDLLKMAAASDLENL